VAADTITINGVSALVAVMDGDNNAMFNKATPGARWRRPSRTPRKQC
jgi:hypothetical protein